MTRFKKGLSVSSVMHRLIVVSFSMSLLIGWLPVAEAQEPPQCFGQTATIVGTNGNNRIHGTRGPDVIVGRDGNDRILSRDGDDRICAGQGFDKIAGGRGDDQISGGRLRDDVIYAESSRGVIVNLARERATGQGADVLIAVEDVTGSDWADVLIGNDEQNILTGKGGRDALRGRSEGDFLNGGSKSCKGGSDGADAVNGGDGHDFVRGCDGRDVLETGSGHDLLVGGRGADTASAGAGSDELVGGAKNDLLDGDRGEDTAIFNTRVKANLTTGHAEGDGSDLLLSVENLMGSDGDDVLIGDGGDNRLDGGPFHFGAGGGEETYGWGDDLIRGRGGRDRINGGIGRDHLIGGKSKDTVLYQTNYAGVGARGWVRANLRRGIARGEGRDRLSSIEGVVANGAFGNVLVGNRRDNRLKVGGFAEGSDRLKGGRGNDRLVTERVLVMGGSKADIFVGGPDFDRCVGVRLRDSTKSCESIRK